MVAAVFLLAVLSSLVTLAFAANACPAALPGQPCPDAGSNRVVLLALASLTAGLLVAPFAFLAEYAVRRRIVYRGAGWRAARRSALVALAIAALAGLRLGNALSVPGGGRGVVRHATPRRTVSWDIFAGQPTDADILAELYDVEHDQVESDVPFVREMARRAPGAALDLGCGSGRLLLALAQGGAPRITGVDGSAALLRRAEERVAGEPALAAMAAEGRLRLVHGDARSLPGLALDGPYALVVASGLLPHLDGPEDALRLLSGVRGLLERDGRLVLDDIGPGEMPQRDLPLSVDWRRTVHGRQVVRRSQLIRREAPEGLRVAFSTIVDVTQPDGTIARLPASYRLWYPSPEALAALVAQAGMSVELAYGSHDLEPLGPDSERRILVVTRDNAATGRGQR
jgi:SAM-dependent methyltransferase